MAKVLFKPRTKKSKRDREASKDRRISRKGESEDSAPAMGFSTTLEKRCGGRK